MYGVFLNLREHEDRYISLTLVYVEECKQLEELVTDDKK